MADSIINTFDKGMHRDSPPILQPDGTYTDMKNGMLISYDGNHYTVELTKGNKVILTLTPRYLASDTVAPFTLDVEPMPIGFASFIDKLVVFSTNNESTSGYGEIGVITFSRIGLDFTGTYVPYYHNASLNFTKLHKIEAWTFRENDNISRVYWTDNFNEPRVFDISNPIFTTYFSAFPATPLIVSNTYMVLSGAVTHNAVNYGPGFAAGNVFVATGTSYVTLDGTPLVIEYYPLSLLDWAPTRLLGNITFKEYGVGNKYCGNHIYFYRLSSSTDAYATSWSYASNPIHVGMGNVSPYLTGNAYRDFVGNGGANVLELSGKSVVLNVTDIDTNFDTIEIACAEFTQVTDVPYRVIITNKIPITSSSMEIIDTGSTNLGTVTISDLTLFPASILKCKTGTTNKNYNIIANITEREEFELDLSGVTITQFEYPMISHGDLSSCSNGNIPADQSPTAGELIANPAIGAIKPWSRYLVSLAPDAANRVEYPVASATYYYTGDVFVGVVGSVTATFTGTAQARPCATRNRYTKINSSAFSGDRVEDAIPLKTAFWDYKDPTIASHNKCYWSTEKYRKAFVAFDTKGNPFYSKFISDFTFSTIEAKGGLMRSDLYSGSNLYSLNPSAVKLSGLDIPESVMNKMSGFSIMRAERDPVIISQGLLMQNIVDVGNNKVMPVPTTRTNDCLFPPFDCGDGYYCYSIICPDSLVGYTFNDPIGAIGSKMKEAFWVNGSDIKSDSGHDVYFTKLFADSGKDADSPRTITLQNMQGVGLYSFDEGLGTPNFEQVSGKDYYNTGITIVSNQFQGYDNACGSDPFNPGPPFSGNGFDYGTVGCKKLVIKSQFHHLGSAVDDYSSTLTVANYNKMVANFITNTDPANQYGGLTEAAISETLYMSTGHFQPINAQVKADTLNGTFASGPYIGENKYTFNDIEIFGGDCFTNLIDVGYSLWDNTYVATNNSISYAMWFPCEGNVNYNLRRGRKVSNSNMYPNGGQSVGYDPVRLEDYSYNKGYSTDGTFVKYPALPLNYQFTGKFEYRMRWAGEKYPGELVNTFRNFRLPDYRDVDGQRGQVNNLKARDSKLFYWQDHSVGYTPILERQLVGGSALGDATALGVTGVIDRYDDIDTNFGNQHQHGLTETEYGYAWFDMRRRAFMVMGIGTKPEEMSMIKGLQGFFNGEFNEGDIISTDRIYNTNDLSIEEKPLMGYGIVGCYDPTFKMTYLTFKYTEYDLVSTPDDTTSRVNKDFTLGYNHILNAFVSFTNNCPAIWHNHNDLVLTANNPKATVTYDDHTTDFTEYKIGDTIQVGETEYICIKDVTIVTWPGTLTGTKTNPLAVGSVYWLAINKTNEIYLQNFGAELCKFYGKVWAHEIELVANFKSDSAVTPQNIQFKSIGPNWTDVHCSTEDQTSQDTSISSTNRNYRWIDKSWFSSLPLPTNGRLTDYYVKIKFTFKNYVTNPTTAKNVQRVSQWLKTMFIKRK